MAGKVEKRRREILKILEAEEEIFIGEIAERFGLTTETIRQDFDYLSEQYNLMRFHGGIKKEQEIAYQEEYRYKFKRQLRIDEKKKICAKAALLVKSGDMIYVDGGSTCSHLLGFLADMTGITVVTPSIPLLMMYAYEGYDKRFLEKGNQFLYLGGQINASLMTTHGSVFSAMLGSLHFDKMFFSCDAMDLKGGITNTDETAFSIIQAVKARARSKILLVDQTKMGLIAHYKAFDLEEVDVIVTTKRLDERWMEILSKSDVSCHCL